MVLTSKTKMRATKLLLREEKEILALMRRLRKKILDNLTFEYGLAVSLRCFLIIKRHEPLFLFQTSEKPKYVLIVLVNSLEW